MIPLADARFLENAPGRRSYADIVAAKEDMSDYDCYAGHEKARPPPIKFDANHRIIIPKEHANIARIPSREPAPGPHSLREARPHSHAAPR